jgi:hypothetical protein
MHQENNTGGHISFNNTINSNNNSTMSYPFQPPYVEPLDPVDPDNYNNVPNDAQNGTPIYNSTLMPSQVDKSYLENTSLWSNMSPAFYMFNQPFKETSYINPYSSTAATYPDNSIATNSYPYTEGNYNPETINPYPNVANSVSTYPNISAPILSSSLPSNSNIPSSSVPSASLTFNLSLPINLTFPSSTSAQYTAVHTDIAPIINNNPNTQLPINSVPYGVNILDTANDIPSTSSSSTAQHLTTGISSTSTNLDTSTNYAYPTTVTSSVNIVSTSTNIPTLTQVNTNMQTLIEYNTINKGYYRPIFSGTVSKITPHNFPINLESSQITRDNLYSCLKNAIKDYNLNDFYKDNPESFKFRILMPFPNEDYRSFYRCITKELLNNLQIPFDKLNINVFIGYPTYWQNITLGKYLELKGFTKLANGSYNFGAFTMTPYLSNYDLPEYWTELITGLKLKLISYTNNLEGFIFIADDRAQLSTIQITPRYRIKAHNLCGFENLWIENLNSLTIQYLTNSLNIFTIKVPAEFNHIFEALISNKTRALK